MLKPNTGLIIISSTQSLFHLFFFFVGHIEYTVLGSPQSEIYAGHETSFQKIHFKTFSLQTPGIKSQIKHNLWNYAQTLTEDKTESG